MTSAAPQLTIVANNEVYNYRELREELAAGGDRFGTESDTEVILRLFAREGPRSVSRLEGMFAFAIWDADTHTLHLARDRFGVKPLYYTVDGGRVLFASEMRAILADPRVPRELDPMAIDGYFASLAIPEPRTALRRVCKLPAGHIMSVQRGRVAIEPYWRPAAAFRQSSQGTARPVARIQADLEAALIRSVTISLRSDVPVAVLLSGGLDSSTVAAIAAREAGTRLSTFSAAFEESAFDESNYARLVATRLGTDHHEVLVTRNRATDIAERLAGTIDEPFADASAVPTSAVCELAGRSVKVVLSGEGSDELFGVYPWHQAAARGRTRAEHPFRVVFTREERRHLYSPAFRRRIDTARLREGAGRPPRGRQGLSRLSRSLLADLLGYLPSDILFKSDRMSMQHSVELRVPYLNHALAAFVMGLPDAQKVRGTVGKFALRRLARPLLPTAVIARAKKGFAVPMDLWLWQKGRWRDLICDVVFSRRTRERGQIRMAPLEELRRRHDRIETMAGYRLWTVFMFEMWQRSFLD